MLCYRNLLFVAMLTLLIGTGAVTVITYTHTYRSDPFDSRPFEATDWAAAEPSERAAMSRDAIRKLPTGLPETEIERLLGPGDIVATKWLIGSEPDGAVRTHLYYLGGYKTFLWVHISRDGCVTEAVIHSR